MSTIGSAPEPNIAEMGSGRLISLRVSVVLRDTVTIGITRVCSVWLASADVAKYVSHSMSKSASCSTVNEPSIPAAAAASGR